MHINGVPINIIEYSKVECAGIPYAVKVSAHNGVDFLNKIAESKGIPKDTWGGFTVFYNLGNGDKHVVIVNDSLSGKKDKLLRDSTLVHEATHIYLRRKCKYLDENFDEGVALARGEDFLKKHDAHSQLYIDSYEKHLYRDLDVIKHTASEYSRAADEIGDDIALIMAKDSMNESTKPLEKFKEKVLDYKARLRLDLLR